MKKLRCTSACTPDLTRGQVYWYDPSESEVFDEGCRYHFVYEDKDKEVFVGFFPEYKFEDVKPFSKYFGWLYGCPSFGGKNGMKLSLTWLWSCNPSWKAAYNHMAPWKKWYSNPWYDNISEYDQLLGRIRTRFIICGVGVQI